MKKFKSCVPVNIKAYLEEQKVEELHRAATLSGDYKLTHQSFSSASDRKDPVFSRPRRTFNSAHSDASGRVPNLSREQEQMGQRRGMVLRSRPVCAYCKRKGHLLSECWELEKKEKNHQRLNSVSVVGNKNPSSGSIKQPPEEVHNIHKPFLSEGFGVLWHCMNVRFQCLLRFYVILEHLPLCWLKECYHFPISRPQGIMF